MNIEIRELTGADLDLVTGAGTVAGYQFCVDGPAGTGLYPEYVDCYPPTMRDIYNSWAQRGRDLAAGKTQF